MVNRKNLKKKYALISVYNKAKLNILCKGLASFDYGFISTGTTGNAIREFGFSCLDVSKITNFKEILDGRVKTLNPKIYGSILFLRDSYDHVKEFKSLNFPLIDIVVVNLYPFVDYSKKYKRNKVIEMIDIGGPSLIRAASKNFQYVTAINEIDDYSKLIRNLEKNKGKTDYEFRKKMAAKTFKTTSKYDRLIYNWLNDYKL